MNGDRLSQLTSLAIKQRFTLLVNRYEVWSTDAAGNPSGMLAFAEQKRLTMREQVTLCTDESRTSVFAAFKARQVLDLGATYDVTDGNGQPIGLFRKDFGRSLLRSTWHVEQPGHAPVTGQERNMVVALLRRFTDITFIPYHFDFTVPGPAGQPGAPAFSVQKNWGIRDTYRVTIADPTLDRRLVAAMAVGLDVLQSR